MLSYITYSSSFTSPSSIVKTSKNYPKGWFYASALFFGVCCYATFVPVGPVWGLNFLAYLPLAFKILMLMIGGVLLIPRVQKKVSRTFSDFFARHNERSVHVFPAAIVAGIGYLLFR